MLLEGWKIHKGLAMDYPAAIAWARIIVSTLIVFVGMCVSFALPASCLKHRKAWSWYAAIVLLGICFGTAILILRPMVPTVAKISIVAAPVAAIIKDVFIMWVFAWGIALNTFNAVASLESLISKRQFVTARTCLRWDSPLEARMPLRCVHFPWEWGALGIFVVAAYLIALDANYYLVLGVRSTAAFWETLLGVSRDLLFVGAIAEVMVFYKIAVSRIRRALQ
jgi:hypothetical protein